MVDIYVKATGNLTVLERALPLLDAELEWWDTNRTLQVTSPYSGNTHTVAHYAVNNSAPRPEGYVEDYTTVHEAEPALNETQRSDLYAELASGAESGWDYTSRWCREPLLNATDNNPALRTLNVRGIVPVDLTALLAGDHSLVCLVCQNYAYRSSPACMNSTRASSRMVPTRVDRMVQTPVETATRRRRQCTDAHQARKVRPTCRTRPL